MNIFIDLGHPAHVHYFKNFIKIMESKGHSVFVSARDRSLIFYLLEKEEIKSYNRGKGSDSIIGKILYMFLADMRLLRKAIRFRPDVFLSFASPYAAQTAWMLRKPHIVLDDTEHARFGHMFYKPFSTICLNPSCFQKDFGKKQIRFNSYSELFYLHPERFSPRNEVLQMLNIKDKERFVILRFVSWKANHDIGHSGLTIEVKKKIVKFLVNNGVRVFISSEEISGDPIFDEYNLNIPPDLIHSVLKYATLLITEGATMASECAMLGTPAVYVNSLDAGTLREQEDKYKLIYGFRSSEGVLEKVSELIGCQDLKKKFQQLQQKMLSEKIDSTALLIWLIENYPSSISILRQKPDYQDFLLT